MCIDTTIGKWLSDFHIILRAVWWWISPHICTLQTFKSQRTHSQYTFIRSFHRNRLGKGISLEFNKTYIEYHMEVQYNFLYFMLYIIRCYGFSTTNTSNLTRIAYYIIYSYIIYMASNYMMMMFYGYLNAARQILYKFSEKIIALTLLLLGKKKKSKDRQQQEKKTKLLQFTHHNNCTLFFFVYTRRKPDFLKKKYRLIHYFAHD